MNTGENTSKAPLLKIVELLQRHQVEFLIIGGQAAALLGSPLPTFDIDLCYHRTPENLERLAQALAELHPTLRGAPPDLPFRLDAQSLALGSNFTFSTAVGALDLLGWVEPFGGYEALLPRAEQVPFGGQTVKVIGLDDLLTIKRYLRRPKDQAALYQLEAIKRLRETEPPSDASR